MPRTQKSPSGELLSVVEAFGKLRAFRSFLRITKRVSDATAEAYETRVSVILKQLVPDARMNSITADTLFQAIRAADFGRTGAVAAVSAWRAFADWIEKTNNGAMIVMPQPRDWSAWITHNGRSATPPRAPRETITGFPALPTGGVTQAHADYFRKFAFTSCAGLGIPLSKIPRMLVSDLVDRNVSINQHPAERMICMRVDQDESAPTYVTPISGVHAKHVRTHLIAYLNLIYPGIPEPARQHLPLAPYNPPGGAVRAMTLPELGTLLRIVAPGTAPKAARAQLRAFEQYENELFTRARKGTICGILGPEAQPPPPRVREPAPEPAPRDKKLPQPPATGAPVAAAAAPTLVTPDGIQIDPKNPWALRPPPPGSSWGDGLE